MSTFLLNAPAVKKVLHPLFSVINTSSVLPILGSVMIQKENGLTFTVSDLENTLSISLNPEHQEGEISFCFNGAALKQLLNASLSELLSFKLLKDKVKIQNGDFNLSKETQIVENFPKSPVVDGVDKISIDCKEIYVHLFNALKFASNDDLRPSMTGVCITDYNGYLHVVATDAHRLYFDSIMKTPAHMKGKTAIIPKKGVRLFLQTFTKGMVDIRLDSNYIQFYQDGKSLTSRLIDANYPDWPKVLPDNDIEFGMQRKNLLSFLKMASVFVNRGTMQMVIVVNKNGISISGGDRDFEQEMEYKMPIYNCNKDFGPFRFGVNLRFLQEIASLSKDEYCVFSHSGLPTKAMIIDKHCLLMPLMLNDID